MLPIMLALDRENVECVQELLNTDVRLDLADGHGNNVYHYAAKSADHKLIQVGAH